MIKRKKSVASKSPMARMGTQISKSKMLNCVIQEPFRAKISMMDETLKAGLMKKMSQLQKTSVTQGRRICRAAYGDMTLIYTTSGRTISFDNILHKKKVGDK